MQPTDHGVLAQHLDDRADGQGEEGEEKVHHVLAGLGVQHAPGLGVHQHSFMLSVLLVSFGPVVGAILGPRPVLWTTERTCSLQAEVYGRCSTA